MAHSEATALRPEAAGGNRILQVERATHRFGDVVALDDVSITARRGRVPHPAGGERLRQDDAAQDRRRARAPDPDRAHRHRRRGRPPRSRRRGATARRCSSTTRSSPTCRSARMSSTGCVCAASTGSSAASGRRMRWPWCSLLDKYGRRVHQLSGGERQRVALARALVTAARDPAARRAARCARREAPRRHAGGAARPAREARPHLHLRYPQLRKRRSP